MFKRSCVHEDRIYIPFMGFRLVFDLGYKRKKYVGWYKP